MQTFVPAGPDLRLGFSQLDYKRLGKQRVEAWQILNILRGVDNEGNPKAHAGGWRNHPATKMWRGFPHGLAYYGKLCCEEWVARGYNDTLLQRFQSVIDEFEAERPWASGTHVIWPPWLFDDCVAETHRSNLIRKDSEHYGLRWPDTPADMEYIWPTTPWKARRPLDGTNLFRSLLTSVSGNDTIAISNEGNALTMMKGAMMATKKAAPVEELELEELDEVEETEETVANNTGMLTAKAAASMLGTDGRTLRKFLRKKYGVLGQGKRWEVDPDDIEELKAEFANFGRTTKADDDDGDDEPKAKTTKPKGKKVTQKAPALDPIYDEIDDIDDIEDLDALEGPEDDELEEIDDLDDLDEI